jgi:hypothetical protein
MLVPTVVLVLHLNSGCHRGKGSLAASNVVGLRGRSESNSRIRTCLQGDVIREIDIPYTTVHSSPLRNTSEQLRLKVSCRLPSLFSLSFVLMRSVLVKKVPAVPAVPHLEGYVVIDRELRAVAVGGTVPRG